MEATGCDVDPVMVMHMELYSHDLAFVPWLQNFLYLAAKTVNNGLQNLLSDIQWRRNVSKSLT